MRHAAALALAWAVAPAFGQDAGGPPPPALRAPFVAFELPTAAVEVELGGHRTFAILDTGAEAHAVGAWLAKKLHLSTRHSSQKTYDAAGRPQAVDVLEHPHLALPGWGELADRPAMVTDEPVMLERLEVGVFLSPQQLATPQSTAVVDLLHRELRRVPAAQAAAELGRAGGARFESIRTCRDPDAQTGYLMYVVQARVGGKDAELILDIGAVESQVSERSGAGKAVLAHAQRVQRARDLGAAGPYATRHVSDVAVELGGWHRSVEMTVGPPDADPHCASDGMLGLDVLDHCEIALTPERAFGACPSPSPAER